MQKTQSPKFLNLYEGADFSLALEYTEDTAVIHLGEFKKFTKNSYKTIQRLKDSWYGFLRTVGFNEVLAAIPKGNHKTKKLAMVFGFKYIGSKAGFDIYILGEEG